MLLKMGKMITRNMSSYVEIKYQLDARDDFYSRSYCLLNKLYISIFIAPNTTGSNLLNNTLELLMMGIMVPETC